MIIVKIKTLSELNQFVSVMHSCNKELVPNGKASSDCLMGVCVHVYGKVAPGTVGVNDTEIKLQDLYEYLHRGISYE